MKIESIISEECSGCSSCSNICPKQCITMIPNEEGFLYPVTDEKKCINCNLCLNRCPSNSDVIESILPINTMGGWSLDIQKKLKSSSGGLFYALAHKIFEKKGVVVGVKLNEKYEAVHSIAKNEKELSLLLGSKYIQSNIGIVYKEVLNFCKKDIWVLFVGTPCQVAGLKRFINHDYEKLICCDIICHGVTSNSLLKSYINSTSDNIESTSINFRDKKEGWNNFSISFTNKNFDKTYLINNKTDLFFKSFLSDIALRNSCYVCKTKSDNVNSDITLGDLWGVESFDHDLFLKSENNGVSAVVVKSEKGQKIIEEIKKDVYLKTISFDDFYKYNPSYKLSKNKPYYRRNFYIFLNRYGIEKTLRKTIDKNKLLKILDKMHSILIKNRGNIT